MMLQGVVTFSPPQRGNVAGRRERGCVEGGVFSQKATFPLASLGENGTTQGKGWSAGERNCMAGEVWRGKNVTTLEKFDLEMLPKVI